MFGLIRIFLINVIKKDDKSIVSVTRKLTKLHELNTSAKIMLERAEYIVSLHGVREMRLRKI